LVPSGSPAASARIAYSTARYPITCESDVSLVFLGVGMAGKEEKGKGRKPH